MSCGLSKKSIAGGPFQKLCHAMLMKFEMNYSRFAMVLYLYGEGGGGALSYLA